MVFNITGSPVVSAEKILTARRNECAGKNRASTKKPRCNHKPARNGVRFVAAGNVGER